jgi:NAD(P)-dependent dehydrogenase (short-subunit alcohol dehydrogenase family)
MDLRRWKGHLADDKLDHPIEDLVLVFDVVVERHRFDSELTSELAHAERLNTARVCHCDGSAKGAIPGHRLSRNNHRHHLTTYGTVLKQPYAVRLIATTSKDTVDTVTTDWNLSRIPSLDGKTVIVTGGNSGIGLAAARALAARGAHVVLAVRDEQRGDDAAATIGGSTEVRRLDLASLASVRAFAAAWRGDIHLLINNAGVLVPPYGLTEDGFELQFGTNHLGHFALTNLLLPQITGRVVTVASGTHRTGTIDFEDLHWASRPYKGGGDAYAQSKLANLLFTLELQRRLKLEKSPVLAMAAHPGMASTNLGSSMGNPVLRIVSALAVHLFAQSAASGAGPTLYAATESLPGNSYAGPGLRREMVGPPVLVGRSEAASDPELAARLWTVSEELTGVRFPSMLHNNR